MSGRKVKIAAMVHAIFSLLKSMFVCLFDLAWGSKMNVVMGSFGNKSLLLLSLGRGQEDLTDFSLKKECGCYLDFFFHFTETVLCRCMYF